MEGLGYVVGPVGTVLAGMDAGGPGVGGVDVSAGAALVAGVCVAVLMGGPDA